MTRFVSKTLRTRRLGIAASAVVLAVALAPMVGGNTGAWGITAAQAQAQAQDRVYDPERIPAQLRQEFPLTDWSRIVVDPAEIQSGGPARDGIPAIDDPTYQSVGQVRAIGPEDPVLGVTINGESRAYPLSILMWHEIANDTLGGQPIAVTFCPLCNTGVVFDRTFDGQVLDFGVTGKLRHSDMIMYDRQTESWWQQMNGHGLIGTYADKRLTMLPARMESFAAFKERAPEGTVLVPTNPRAKRYGENPYWGYDGEAVPKFYRGSFPEGIAPLARVVVIDDRAWALDLIAEKGQIVLEDGVTIRFAAGQRSALDAPRIEFSRQVGGVTVTRPDGQGGIEDVVHIMAFAFAFHALYPDGEIITE